MSVVEKRDVSPFWKYTHFAFILMDPWNCSGALIEVGDAVRLVNTGSEYIITLRRGLLRDLRINKY